MFQGRFVSILLALLLPLPCPASAARAVAVRASAAAHERVSELVDELQHELAQKDIDADYAKDLVERLAAEFAVAGTKERAPIVRVLERALAAKDQGKPDVELVCHSARALAAMAPESLPVLARALENKLLLKEKEIGRTLALALGKTRAQAAQKPLLGLLDSSDDGLVAAAGEALGEYEGAPLATRKQLFEEVLKALVQAKDQRDAQLQQSLDPAAPHDDSAAKRYDAIQAALGTTLARLSKQESRDPEQWQRWWNKNKRANWDDKSKLS